MPISEAVCPAGISSFFEICNTDANGRAFVDPERIGARGGGFAIQRGVRAQVKVKKSTNTHINVVINGRLAPEAQTTKWALERLLEKARIAMNVEVSLKVSVPMGAGYGTSAAGTAASCLALADATNISITMNELGKLVHVAEVLNRTGLGTASALMIGGFVLVTEPGAPSVGVVDRLIFPRDHAIVCAYFAPIPTRSSLEQHGIEARVNPPARLAMKTIMGNPCISTFLAEARKFSAQVGFLTDRVSQMMETMLAAGANGVAQNMIGEAVHAVAEKVRIPRLIKAAKRASPSATVFSTELSIHGVRLVN